MPDFAGNRNAPQLGQVCNNVDLGAVITLTAAGAGTTNSPDLTNNGGRGLVATLDITAKSGTIDVVVNIQIKDQASGKYTTLLASASKTAVSTTRLVVYPTITASANLIAQDVINEVFRVQVVSGAGSTPSFTATVGVCILA